MTKLPVLSGRELIKALRAYGFIVERQRGSHVRLVMRSSGKTIKLTVPLHDALKKGTLKRILADAGVTEEKLVELMKR